ncbi:MAG: hypothetical protein IJ315_05545, partial [Firmicutes bacterium]|nr:hypothetical protein [Bacillota bacterium]
MIKRGNSVAYQYYDHGDKRWNDVTDNFILQKKIMRAKELENLLMPQLEALKSNDKKTYGIIRNYLEEERRRVLAEYMVTTKPYPEQHTIYTPHGDFVSSKSELSMSMLMDLLRIKH